MRVEYFFKGKYTNGKDYTGYYRGTITDKVKVGNKNEWEIRFDNKKSFSLIFEANAFRYPISQSTCLERMK